MEKTKKLVIAALIVLFLLSTSISFVAAESKQAGKYTFQAEGYTIEYILPCDADFYAEKDSYGPLEWGALAFGWDLFRVYFDDAKEREVGALTVYHLNKSYWQEWQEGIYWKQVSTFKDFDEFFEFIQESLFWMEARRTTASGHEVIILEGDYGEKIFWVQVDDDNIFVIDAERAICSSPYPPVYCADPQLFWEIVNEFVQSFKVTAIEQPHTYYVNPGESIQDAVDNASDGDTIIVYPGTYTENVKVNKRLTIKSENGAEATIVQAANPGDYAFCVWTDYVNISGFTVKGGTGDGSAGIHIRANYCNISNNNCSSNEWYGILLNFSNNNIISKNNCSNNRDGIYLLYSNGNTISKNNCLSNRRPLCGISLTHSNNNTISDNTCSNSVGVSLGYSNNNTISNNNCSNNKMSSGIHLWHSKNNIISKNNCSHNSWGISTFYSNDNIIYLNNFAENAVENVDSLKSANTWNSPSKITYTYYGNTFTDYLGNYWEDYQDKYPGAKEKDNTGIWNTPYEIDGDKDYYPLMKPWPWGKAPEENWEQKHSDQKNSRYCGTKIPTNLKLNRSIIVELDSFAPGAIGAVDISSPLVVGDRIIFTTSGLGAESFWNLVLDGSILLLFPKINLPPSNLDEMRVVEVYCYNLSGQEEWNWSAAGDDILITSDGKYVYTAITSNFKDSVGVVKLDISNGSKVWTWQPAEYRTISRTTGLIVDKQNGYLYLSGYQTIGWSKDFIFRIDTESKEVKEYEIPVRVYGNPVLIEDCLVMRDESITGGIYKLDLSTGEPPVSLTEGYACPTFYLAAVNDRIVAITKRGMLPEVLCLDLQGNRVWSYNASGKQFAHNLAIDQATGRIYVSYEGSFGVDNVIALDKEGKELETFTCEPRWFNHFVLACAENCLVAYHKGSDDILYQIDKNLESFKKYDIPDFWITGTHILCDAPVVANGKVILVYKGSILQIIPPFIKNLAKIWILGSEGGDIEQSISAGLFSPANLHAYDKYGNHVGLNVTSGEIEKEIPNTHYTGPNSEPEVITVYGKADNITFKVEALEEGKFNLTITQSTEAGTTEIIYNDVPIAETTEATVEVSEANPTYIMEIDDDGDGTTDRKREPESIDGIGQDSYSIQLQKGWNLISLPLTPEDTNVLNVLNSVEGNGNSVWSYEGGKWKRYDLAGPDFLNTLTIMEPGKGYWLNMKSDDTLSISGCEPRVKSIPLSAGWNLVGYNSLNSMSTAEAMSSVAGNWNSVWSYEAGRWKRYDMTGPDFLNSLTIMEPGKGYWLNMKSTDTWTLGA